MTPEPFTLELYREYLVSALDVGYRFVGFDELDGELPLIVLRHDVDYSPRRAVAMARLEQELGVRGTYCVHVSCPWYSVDGEPHRSSVEAILDAGHDLGLHFDGSEIESDTRAATEVERDAARLSELFDKPVTAVSFHMPGRRSVGSVELAGSRVNAYAPRFFDEIAYASDSNQDWRGTDLGELLRTRAAERLQLLIHPFWWRERPGTIGEKLTELAGELGVPMAEIATWEQQELIRAGR